MSEHFRTFAERAAHAVGSYWAFMLALAVVIIWGGTGPIFNYSDTWQLIINTGTTIVTFLMVFLIQHAQNKENRALQLKLNELIAAMEGASNRLIDVEDLSDRELEHLYWRFQNLAETAQRLEPGAQTTIDSEKEAENEGEAKDRSGKKRAG